MDVVVERERAFPIGASIKPTAIPALLAMKLRANVPFDFSGKLSMLEGRSRTGSPV